MWIQTLFDVAMSVAMETKSPNKDLHQAEDPDLVL